MMRPHSSASPGATGLIVISISLLRDSSSASVGRVQRADERRIRRVRQLSHSLFDDPPVLKDQLARNLTRAHLEDVQQSYLDLRPDGRGRVQDAVARKHDPRDAVVPDALLARTLPRAHLEDVQQSYLDLRPDGRGRVQDAVARKHDPRDAVVHDALFRSESLKATELFDLKRVEHAPVHRAGRLLAVKDELSRGRLSHDAVGVKL